MQNKSLIVAKCGENESYTYTAELYAVNWQPISGHIEAYEVHVYVRAKSDQEPARYMNQFRFLADAEEFFKNVNPVGV
jgi:hypothetical protein